jgi:cytochrome c5
MSNCRNVLILFFFAGAMLTLSGQQPVGDQTSREANPLHTIVLPESPVDIPAGPNVDVYRKDCQTCHSARYVLMQPSFPRAVWEKEVKKMVDVYGATVPEPDQPKIVDYLVAVRGVNPGSEDSGKPMSPK